MKIHKLFFICLTICLTFSVACDKPRNSSPKLSDSLAAFEPFAEQTNNVTLFFTNGTVESLQEVVGAQFSIDTGSQLLELQFTDKNEEPIDNLITLTESAGSNENDPIFEATNLALFGYEYLTITAKIISSDEKVVSLFIRPSKSSTGNLTNRQTTAFSPQQDDDNAVTRRRKRLIEYWNTELRENPRLDGVQKFACLVQYAFDTGGKGSFSKNLVINDLIDILVNPNSYQLQKSFIMQKHGSGFSINSVEIPDGDLSGFKPSLTAGDGRYRHFIMNAGLTFDTPPSGARAVVLDFAVQLGTFDPAWSSNPDTIADLETNAIGREFGLFVTETSINQLGDGKTVKDWMVDKFGDGNQVTRHEIQIVVNPTKGGTVSDPLLNGNDCDDFCDYYLEDGKPVTLLASPSPGFRFVNFVDANNKPVSTAPIYSFTPSKDAIFGANFKRVSEDVGVIDVKKARRAWLGTADGSFVETELASGSASLDYDLTNATAFAQAVVQCSESKLTFLKFTNADFDGFLNRSIPFTCADPLTEPIILKVNLEGLSGPTQGLISWDAPATNIDPFVTFTSDLPTVELEIPGHLSEVALGVSWGASLSELSYATAIDYEIPSAGPHEVIIDLSSPTYTLTREDVLIAPASSGVSYAGTIMPENVTTLGGAFSIGSDTPSVPNYVPDVDNNPVKLAAILFENGQSILYYQGDPPSAALSGPPRLEYSIGDDEIMLNSGFEALDFVFAQYDAASGKTLEQIVSSSAISQLDKQLMQPSLNALENSPFSTGDSFILTRLAGSGSSSFAGTWLHGDDPEAYVNEKKDLLAPQIFEVSVGVEVLP